MSQRRKRQWIPNIFSLSRILLTPVVVLLLHFKYNVLALVAFSLAALTDFFDGHYARRFDAGSAWGIFLDPLADKILVHGLFLYLCFVGLISWIPVLLVLFRDILITVLRTFVGVKKCSVPASIWGKLKTFMQMTLLFSVLFLNIWGARYLAGVKAYMNVGAWLIFLVAAVSAWGYFKRCVLESYKVSILEVFYWTLATGFGIGFSPIFPGSIASAATVVAWFFIPDFGWIFDFVVLGFLAILGFLSSDFVAQRLKVHDPSCIVVDEFLGMWMALLVVPKSLPGALVAFLAFRFFDVLKPFFISRIEKIDGGLGIMLDDAAAALFAILVIKLISLSGLI
ncbi:phosphatidylglycerophosphatase A [Candidatus Dependentiae bacterium]